MKPSHVSFAVVVVLVMAGTRAEAAEYLFGGSGGTSYLDLGFADASTATLDTDTSKFGDARNQGWWNKEGNNQNSAINDNYIVGDLSNDGTRLLNNFFTFDISALGGTVTSATLRLRRYSSLSTLGATHHLYSLYDVSTDPAVLNNNTGYSATIYDDLGSGVNYGNFPLVVGANSSDILHLSLNANALADLNAAIQSNAQFFSIGGTLSPVPEPSSLVLAGLGIACGLALRARSLTQGQWRCVCRPRRR